MELTTIVCRRCGARRNAKQFRARKAYLEGGVERHYRERVCKPCQAKARKQRVVKRPRDPGPSGIEKVYFCEVRPTWKCE